MKTPGRWRYEMTEPGVFVWTSPLGNSYLRDHTGSHPSAAPGPNPEHDAHATPTPTRPTSEDHAPDPARATPAGPQARQGLETPR